MRLLPDSEEMEEEVQREREDARAEQDADRQREHPGQDDIAQRVHSQSGVIGRHGPGYPGRQNVGGADGQTETVREANGSSGDKLRRSALPVGEVFLAIFSPTVTTIRFQPIMVPKPSAQATAIFTQTSMYCVSLLKRPLYSFNVATSVGSAILFAFSSFPTEVLIR